MVGTGPYTITDVAPGTGITYTKNPNYYRHDEKFPENRLPYIDVVKGFEIPERATWIAGIRTGKLDYIGWQGVTHLNSIDEKESLERTNPELVFGAWSERSETSHLFNIHKPPFDDVKVRRAMQMALDLETINATYFKYGADTVPRGRIHLGRGITSHLKSGPKSSRDTTRITPKGPRSCSMRLDFLAKPTVPGSRLSSC